MLKWIGILNGKAGLVYGQLGRYKVVQFEKLAIAGSADLGDDEVPHVVQVSKREEAGRVAYQVMPQDIEKRFACDPSPQGGGASFDHVVFAEFSRQADGKGDWSITLDNTPPPVMIVSARP